MRKTPTKHYLPQVQQKLGAIPGIQMFPVMPPALPGGGQFPGQFRHRFDRRSGAHPRVREADFRARRCRRTCFSSRDIDTKIDQPQAEIVFDHDKVAAMGLNMQQVGADLSASIGGNFVNRFNMDGPQLQSDPADQAHRSFESGTAQRHLRHRPERPADSAEHHRDDRHKTVARSLNRMQQLNAVTISGVPARLARCSVEIPRERSAQDSCRKVT